MEKVFGTLKRTYGYSRVRYMGLERNDGDVVEVRSAQSRPDSAVGETPREKCVLERAGVVKESTESPLRSVIRED